MTLDGTSNSCDILKGGSLKAFVDFIQLGEIRSEMNGVPLPYNPLPPSYRRLLLRSLKLSNESWLGGENTNGAG